MNRTTNSYALFTAQAANGNSNPIQVTSFRNAIIQWGTAGSFDGVLRVKGAIGETAPDFTAAASQSNQHHGRVWVQRSPRRPAPKHPLRRHLSACGVGPLPAGRNSSHGGHI